MTAVKPTDKQFTKTVDGIGPFSFKYTNLMDELEIDHLATQLLRGNSNPSLTAGNIATMMATLKIAIVKAPDNFVLDQLYNYDELKRVYDIYYQQVLPFRFDEKDPGTSP